LAHKLLVRASKHLQQSQQIHDHFSLISLANRHCWLLEVNGATSDWPCSK